MSHDTITGITNVFLGGDSEPICTTLTGEEISQLMLDATLAGGPLGDGSLIFIRLPVADAPDDLPAALVRPSAIVAVVPVCASEDDED